MLKIITLISIIIFWESITMANDSKENDFIMDIVKGETKFILKNNMKQNDFILHLNGRRNRINAWIVEPIKEELDSENE